eukprot:4143075-Amphidinium_carterae.7
MGRPERTSSLFHRKNLGIRPRCGDSVRRSTAHAMRHRSFRSTCTRHDGRGIWLAFHGDDFLTVMRGEHTEWMDEVMRQGFKIEVLPKIGPGAASSGNTGKFLNRTIDWVDREWLLLGARHQVRGCFGVIIAALGQACEHAGT